MPSMRTLLVSAAFAAATMLSPAALAKCPKSVAGVWSGTLQTLSFSEDGQLTDVSVGIVRFSLGSDGTATGNFEGRNSSKPVGETGADSGTYVFDTAQCRVRITSTQAENGEVRMQITDNGRVMTGFAFGSPNSEERDAETFTLYRE